MTLNGVSPCVANVGADCAVCHKSNKRRLLLLSELDSLVEILGHTDRHTHTHTRPIALRGPLK